MAPDPAELERRRQERRERSRCAEPYARKCRRDLDQLAREALATQVMFGRRPESEKETFGVQLPEVPDMLDPERIPGDVQKILERKDLDAKGKRKLLAGQLYIVQTAALLGREHPGRKGEADSLTKKIWRELGELAEIEYPKPDVLAREMREQKRTPTGNLANLNGTKRNKICNTLTGISDYFSDHAAFNIRPIGDYFVEAGGKTILFDIAVLFPQLAMTAAENSGLKPYVECLIAIDSEGRIKSVNHYEKSYRGKPTVFAPFIGKCIQDIDIKAFRDAVRIDAGELLKHPMHQYQKTGEEINYWGDSLAYNEAHLADLLRRFPPTGRESLDSKSYSFIKRSGDQIAIPGQRAALRRTASAWLRERGNKIDPVVKMQLMRDMASSYLQPRTANSKDLSNPRERSFDYDGEKALPFIDAVLAELEKPATENLSDKFPESDLREKMILECLGLRARAFLTSFKPAAEVEEAYEKALERARELQKPVYEQMQKLIRESTAFSARRPQLAVEKEKVRQEWEQLGEEIKKMASTDPKKTGLEQQREQKADKYRSLEGQEGDLSAKEQRTNAQITELNKKLFRIGDLYKTAANEYGRFLANQKNYRAILRMKNEDEKIGLLSDAISYIPQAILVSLRSP